VFLRWTIRHSRGSCWSMLCEAKPYELAFAKTEEALASIPAFPPRQIRQHPVGDNDLGRNAGIDASASCPVFANANSYGWPRKACSSSFRENGESSTARHASPACALHGWRRHCYRLFILEAHNPKLRSIT